ncbi:MAG: hypothetical protein LKK36_19615 [Ewingella americana]|jgi:hypothetical protein|uniref:hypothetical protein n=1 Tax=Ewingella americana TaxID=41202 RepID=UPI0024328E7B|nr:hypothetical protein [Ewingella americana]MCI1676697.1 hypothetical protein [Ewingella americana]MCI1853713.1 hypothetical protein [Ewingella americana]MCI1860046.1 hypothetical protein [Ewingella americana]MCI2143229.1 hypothetical protein [Ewingella americana]MCI2165883.1 hypothetical protein [Ewingella americana]
MIFFELWFSDQFRLERLAEIATVITPIIAFGAIFFAKYQLISSRKDSRRSSAYSAYGNYLELCFNYPCYSGGFDFGGDNGSVDSIKYKWFVARMLFSFEQILDVCEPDDGWEKTILQQLKRHREQLKISGSVNRKEWSKDLSNLISKAIILE